MIELGVADKERSAQITLPTRVGEMKNLGLLSPNPVVPLVTVLGGYRGALMMIVGTTSQFSVN
jgi:hypothetical protein